jgi:hypothetical protein
MALSHRIGSPGRQFACCRHMWPGALRRPARPAAGLYPLSQRWHIYAHPLRTGLSRRNLVDTRIPKTRNNMLFPTMRLRTVDDNRRDKENAEKSF